jgi:hypothetical protein
MGNHNSTRWRGHAKKRTVEECRRITAREARHVGGIGTTATTVADSKARRLWCLCPSCGAQVWLLYQVEDGGVWKCRACHDLAYTSQQQRGTMAAFRAWLNQERWREYSEQHPAQEWLRREAGSTWKAMGVPYDLRSMSIERRLELRQQLGSDAAIERHFDQERMKWSEVLHGLEQEAGRRIMADLKAEWKRRNRSQKRGRR